MKIPDNVIHALGQQRGLYAPIVQTTGQPEAPIAVLLYGNFDRAGIAHSHKTVFLPAEVVRDIKELQLQAPQQNNDTRYDQRQREMQAT